MSWIDDMLIHSVTWQAVNGFTASQDRTYATGVVLPARVERTSTLTRDMDGEEIVVTHQVALKQAVREHDRLTLPDGSVRIVRNVSDADGLDGEGYLCIAEVS